MQTQQFATACARILMQGSELRAHVLAGDWKSALRVHGQRFRVLNALMGPARAAGFHAELQELLQDILLRDEALLYCLEPQDAPHAVALPVGRGESDEPG